MIGKRRHRRHRKTNSISSASSSESNDSSEPPPPTTQSPAQQKKQGFVNSFFLDLLVVFSIVFLQWIFLFFYVFLKGSSYFGGLPQIIELADDEHTDEAAKNDERMAVDDYIEIVIGNQILPLNVMLLCIVTTIHLVCLVFFGFFLDGYWYC